MKPGLEGLLVELVDWRGLRGRVKSGKEGRAVACRRGRRGRRVRGRYIVLVFWGEVVVGWLGEIGVW